MGKNLSSAAMAPLIIMNIDKNYDLISRLHLPLL
jgi:hypothetical protein